MRLSRAGTQGCLLACRAPGPPRLQQQGPGGPGPRPGLQLPISLPQSLSSSNWAAWFFPGGEWLVPLPGWYPGPAGTRPPSPHTALLTHFKILSHHSSSLIAPLASNLSRDARPLTCPQVGTAWAPLPWSLAQARVPRMPLRASGNRNTLPSAQVPLRGWRGEGRGGREHLFLILGQGALFTWRPRILSACPHSTRAAGCEGQQSYYFFIA